MDSILISFMYSFSTEIPSEIRPPNVTNNFHLRRYFPPLLSLQAHKCHPKYANKFPFHISAISPSIPKEEKIRDMEFFSQQSR